jgi:hypothetical protein
MPSITQTAKIGRPLLCTLGHNPCKAQFALTGCHLDWYDIFVVPLRCCVTNKQQDGEGDAGELLSRRSDLRETEFYIGVLPSISRLLS